VVANAREVRDESGDTNVAPDFLMIEKLHSGVHVTRTVFVLFHH